MRRGSTPSASGPAFELRLRRLQEPDEDVPDPRAGDTLEDPSCDGDARFEPRVPVDARLSPVGRQLDPALVVNGSQRGHRADHGPHDVCDVPWSIEFDDFFREDGTWSRDLSNGPDSISVVAPRPR